VTRDPEISVAIASRDRPVRLRWLLNALEEQTLAKERFEVVLAHNLRPPEADELLLSHPLARAGVLRYVALPPSEGAARNRNASWRMARAPLVAFIDDDCRPSPGWLEETLAAARRHPGAIVQGRTLPDPDEAAHITASAFALTQWIDPPSPWAETCNIVYPREVLERHGGFDEAAGLVIGEDTDLAWRALGAGTRQVAAPEALVWHAVEPVPLRRVMRWNLRWRQFPLLARRHPGLRAHFPGRYFWKQSHPKLLAGLAGLALARRHPALAVLALPWLMHNSTPRYGPTPRGRARVAVELPGRLARDLSEVAVLAAGSVQYRSLLL
jgi:GT2 family glycosyltransferase